MIGTATAAVARRKARLDAALAIEAALDGNSRYRGRRAGKGRLHRRRRRRLHGDPRRRVPRRLRADVPEAALALLVARDGGVEVRSREVGPEDVGEVELRVRETIEQKVGDAPLAPRPN